MPEPSNKTNKAYKIVIAILIIIIGAGGYFGGNYIYDIGYNDGHHAGYSEGKEIWYNRGYQNGKISGYDEGYNVGTYESTTNTEYPGNYYGPADNTRLSVSEAPDSYVWTTPSGEKYHRGWCRYVADRTDLTYFTSASEAADYGYSPCNVCY